jgi:phosphohistidine phosphatase
LVGRYLAKAGLQPELVLCSPATRARETLELLDLPRQTAVSIEDDIYGADAMALLSGLQKVPPKVKTVLLIGHNPGIEDATRMLLGDGLGGVEKFPTAALADVRLPIATWKEISRGTGKLQTFVVPRQLDQG